ncbi:mex-1 [Pristionchus pacificus]|uniref:Mex-1 n=1 Tax=Pristionchus pacificus TaxID=54126 RepID=A0A2A6BNK1_PRIPA|nr:mex-1 [Pristionchus pacificus]|eukprot:PDM67542.1 mex-1 [Pristionchus pacificus]
MAHSFRRSSYGGGNSSSYHPHHNPRHGGYNASSRHHRGAVAEDDEYYQYATSTHHNPHHHHQHQHHHHHQQHRRSGGGGGDRYASDAGLRHDRGYGGHRNRAYYEEDDVSHAQHQPPQHHARANSGHRQQSQLQLQVLQQLPPQQQPVADAQEVPETPGTPPSIMHVGMKIPITDFFPGQKGIVAYTPDTELPVDENEPIEAGRLPKKKRTESTTSSASGRRESTGDAAVSALEQFECEDVARHKRKEEAYKTALCDAYRKSSECSYGKQCRFAHGEHELRLPPQPRGKAHPKYKTQLCDKFSVYGYCPYGPRCQFIHMMKKGLPLVEYEKKVRAGKISPTRECVEFIDEDDMESSYTRNNGRPFTVYQVDSRRYSKAGGGKESRRRSYQDEYGRGGSSRRDDDYEPTERIHRHRSIEALNADAPRVTYEKIPTTPKRAPVRPRELSLIHEETGEHESPPSSTSQPSSSSSSARHPGWVTHLMQGCGAHLAPPAASPRTTMKARGPPKMEQIEENEEGDYSEDHRYRKLDPRRSHRA